MNGRRSKQLRREQVGANVEAFDVAFRKLCRRMGVRAAYTAVGPGGMLVGGGDLQLARSIDRLLTDAKQNADPVRIDDDPTS